MTLIILISSVAFPSFESQVSSKLNQPVKTEVAIKSSTTNKGTVSFKKRFAPSGNNFTTSYPNVLSILFESLVATKLHVNQQEILTYDRPIRTSAIKLPVTDPSDHLIIS